MRIGTSKIPVSNQGKANFGSATPTPSSGPTPPSGLNPQTNQSQSVNFEENQPVKADKAPSMSSEGDMSLAVVGASIMPDKVYEKRDVDTSDLSLAAAGERIMPKKPPEHYPEPSIDHLKLED